MHVPRCSVQNGGSGGGPRNAPWNGGGGGTPFDMLRSAVVGGNEKSHDSKFLLDGYQQRARSARLSSFAAVSERDVVNGRHRKVAESQLLVVKQPREGKLARGLRV